MSISDLRSWPIVSALNPEFIPEIYMVLVFGKLGHEALIVTKDKMMYALGNNKNGCLGTGNTRCYKTVKKIDILCMKDIKTFAYGFGPHVLALMKDGKIYSWGCNNYGQVGNGSYDQVVTPTLINIPNLNNLDGKRVVDIACGSYHSIALTESGEVYAWGINDYRIIKKDSLVDINMNQTTTNTPKLVNITFNGEKIVNISCGMTFTLAVTEKGEVYSWGENDVGQLGIGHYEDTTIPTLISSLRGTVIVKVACGNQHTLALTDKGNLYVWGGNHYGQLGIGNQRDSYEPVLVKHRMGRVSDITAVHSRSISIAVDEGGRIYVWGYWHGMSVLIPSATPSSNIHNAIASYGSPSIMHKPLILREDEEPSILKHLETAFDDSSTSDFKIQVYDRCIHVHKAILRIRSSYFRAMFQHEWLENNQNVLKHNQFSDVVYEAFLKYLYTDVVNLPWEQALELLILADVYCESSLKKHCIQIIKRKITVSNVAYLYSIAIERSDKELEKFCFNFAINHLTAVVQTESFAKLDENTLRTFIIKAVKAGALGCN
ncbi:PREDICTED: RCC1 and BTB domain-containing protein 1-like [Cyphomyrmex costatus]|uniref:RCC1 and BTB domain-containing protein 1-like n=1 Tax=Cyphomyrmex costatus TaxID=456900 RepID=UPI00085232A7|nr:PREDICTED: RCC1 and BTB domain-containing protein 1-like [Cyphomyrmex costatus]